MSDSSDSPCGGVPRWDAYHHRMASWDGHAACRTCMRRLGKACTPSFTSHGQLRFGKRSVVLISDQRNVGWVEPSTGSTWVIAELERLSLLFQRTRIVLVLASHARLCCQRRPCSTLEQGPLSASPTGELVAWCAETRHPCKRRVLWPRCYRLQHELESSTLKDRRLVVTQRFDSMIEV